jgi:O-antigen ligase
MTDGTPPAAVPATRAHAVLAWAGAVGLGVLSVVLYLGADGVVSAATLIRAGTVAASAGTLAWLARGGGRGLLRPGRALVPYAIYAAALAIVFAASPTADASRELWRQATFLAVIAAAAAPLPVRPGAILGAHVACLLLVLIQLPGPRSGFDHLGRAAFYHALEQWSGYPELGLLMAIGASAMVGVLCASHEPAVRLGAGVLAVAFTGATVFLQSRASVLAIPLVALWLFGVAAVRWRSRLAMAGLVVALAAGAFVAVRGGGASALASRAAGTFARETAIRAQGWSAARTMASEHPLAGVGLGAYQREYQARNLGGDPMHAYNIVLHVVAEGGAIGLAGLLALWARALWLGVRRASRTPSGAALFALHGMLLAFFVRSQSEHFLANLATSDRILLLVAIWIGLSERLALAAPAANGRPAAAPGPRPETTSPAGDA